MPPACDLVEAGLDDVDCEGRGGTAWRLKIAQLRERMVAAGLVSSDQVDTAMALCADRRFSFLSQITMAAWGRPS